jgi:hypothetical protein
MRRVVSRGSSYRTDDYLRMLRDRNEDMLYLLAAVYMIGVGVMSGYVLAELLLG